VNIGAGGCGDIDHTLRVSNPCAGCGEIPSACVDEDVGSAGGGGYVVRNSSVGNGDVEVLVVVKVINRYCSLLVALVCNGGGNGLVDNLKKSSKVCTLFELWKV
jgi:hypothetical protein